MRRLLLLGSTLMALGHAHAASQHTCMRTAAMTLECWGDNTYGQLGQGLVSAPRAPITVPGLAQVADSAAGHLHQCAIAGTGQASCWGLGVSGQLGNGASLTSSSPVLVSNLGVSTSIAAGDSHTCAVAAGQVFCWGNNGFGQLGTGNFVSSNVPVAVQGIVDAVRVAAGERSSCALLASGTVSCWGRNENGQLGNGNTTASNVPVDVSGITTATRLTMTSRHACVLLQNETVRCWGASTGNGATSNSSLPITIAGVSTATQVAAGGAHSCALLADTTVRCWGSRNFGQFGDGTLGGFGTAGVPVIGLSNAVDLFAGGTHSCVRKSDGTRHCWGGNVYRQAGNARPGLALAPADVFGLSAVVDVTAGTDFACAAVDAGGARCWGQNNSGQLGNGQAGVSEHLGIPTTVLQLPSATKISSGNQFSCAIPLDGTVRCWGSGVFGNLGNGASQTSLTPVQVTGITNASRISAGSSSHACAILLDGGLRCWGANGNGQLGNGGTSNSNLPVVPEGLTSIVSVASGPRFTCAVASGGAAHCWGTNGNGQLGNGTTVQSLVPVSVSGLTNAIKVAAGGAYACALTSLGDVFCWGAQAGQTASTNVPVQVAGISNAVDIGIGYSHTCALLSGGQMRCWGSLEMGQLGTGIAGPRLFASSPQDVLLTASGLSLGVNGNSTCVRLTTGRVQCFGVNTHGQLGSGQVGAMTTIANVPDAYPPSGLRIAVSALGGRGSGYQLIVRNEGESAANAANLIAAIGGLSNITWTCSAPITDCVPANGTGNVNLNVDIPTSGEVIVLVNGDLEASAAFVQFSVRATLPAGSSTAVAAGGQEMTSIPANGIGVFRDGFE